MCSARGTDPRRPAFLERDTASDEPEVLSRRIGDAIRLLVGWHGREEREHRLEPRKILAFEEEPTRSLGVL